MSAPKIKKRLLDFIEQYDAVSREEQRARERETGSDRAARISEQQGFREALRIVRQEIESIRDW